jgi:hypothetical protein
MRQKRLREFGSKKDIGMSLLWYWLGYVAVTSVGIAHTIFNILVLHMSSMAQGPGLGQGYEATKPWHPLYNIILFTLFGFLYLRKVKEPTFKKAAITGALWSGISIVIDVFGWVIIKHPWSLTFKQFYVEYQPWITIIYITIFLAPVVSFLLMRRSAKKVKTEMSLNS